MSIVTLTSDFGNSDYYVAQFKGLLLSAASTVQVIDISHDVPSYNINVGAFMLKNVFHVFPPGSIHVLRVYETGIKNHGLVAISWRKHFFIAPDNGILSMIVDENVKWVYRLEDDEDGFQKADQYYIQWIGDILKDGRPVHQAIEAQNWVKKSQVQPVIKEDSIVGVVMLIDKFGNAITNIHLNHLNKFRDTEHLELYFRKSESSSKFVESYDDVAPGMDLVRFNDNGYMEIAVHQGNFSQLFSIKPGHQVLLTCR